MEFPRPGLLAVMGIAEAVVRPARPPDRSCHSLGPEQEERIQRLTCYQRPEQLKLDFDLWTRSVVMLLIERVLLIECV
ncbi:MAG: hypothetical protein ACYCSN_06780 [Acidobacteriaceae bacterium]